MFDTEILESVFMQSVSQVYDRIIDESDAFMTKAYKSKSLTWNDIIQDRFIRRSLRSLETIMFDFKSLKSSDWHKLGGIIGTPLSISFGEFLTHAPSSYRDSWIHYFQQTYSYNVLHGGPAKNAFAFLKDDYLKRKFTSTHNANAFGLEDVLYVVPEHSFESPDVESRDSQVTVLMSNYDYKTIWPDENGDLILKSEGVLKPFSSVISHAKPVSILGWQSFDVYHIDFD